MSRLRRPRLGESVYFYMPADAIAYAALVIGVGASGDPPGIVDLVVFDTAGMHWDLSVAHRTIAGDHSYWEWPGGGHKED